MSNYELLGSNYEKLFLYLLQKNKNKITHLPWTRNLKGFLSPWERESKSDTRHHCSVSYHCSISIVYSLFNLYVLLPVFLTRVTPLPHCLGQEKLFLCFLPSAPPDKHLAACQTGVPAPQSFSSPTQCRVTSRVVSALKQSCGRVLSV